MTKFSIYDPKIANKGLQFKSKENTIKVNSDFYLDQIKKRIQDKYQISVVFQGRNVRRLMHFKVHFKM